MSIFSKKIWTEDELLDGCAANDRRAQEAFYRRFFPEMWRMTIRRTADEDQAMEIVNAGFLRAFQKIHTFERRGSLEGWLRRLVWHALADFFRERKRYVRFLVFEERDQKIAERGADRMQADDLLRMVAQLPPASRKVFEMFAIEGFSHLEIAAELGISEGTSKWHLNNARTLLKSELQKLESIERRHAGRQ